MVAILPITVVNELNHPVEFDVSPVVPQGKTYAMQIREDAASTGTAEVDFLPNIQGTVVKMVGDCTNLDPTKQYKYDLEENGITICSGSVAVIQQVTK